MDEGQALAQEFGIAFFETSAKENIGVKEAFSTLSKEVKDRVLTADGTEQVSGFKADVVRLAGGHTSDKSNCSC